MPIFPDSSGGAGSWTVSGTNNYAGTGALPNVTTGLNNVAAGNGTLAGVTTGSNNVALGIGANPAANTNNATAIGATALALNDGVTIGANARGPSDNSVIIGANAGPRLAGGSTSGSVIIGMGAAKAELENAGASIISGSVILGEFAGVFAINATDCFYGSLATLRTNNTSPCFRDVVISSSSGSVTFASSYNTIIGFDADGFQSGTNQLNLILGGQLTPTWSARSNMTKNVLIGSDLAGVYTSRTLGTVVGYGSGVSANNATALGANALNATANSVLIGGTGTLSLRTPGKIYPGTDANAVQTAAGLYAGTGAPNNANGADGDYYFRSDAAGNTALYQKRAGSWEAIIGGGGTDQTTFNGLENNALFAVSYDALSRQFLVSYTVGAAVWVNGVRFAKSGLTLTAAHANTTGKWFLYYDAAGVLTVSSTPFNLLTQAPVGLVYYNAVDVTAVLFNERHPAGTGMSNAAHLYNHETRGTQVVNGFAISGYTLNTDGQAANSYAVDSGVIADEDLETTATALVDGGPYRIFYREGAAGIWTFDDVAGPSGAPVLGDGTDIQWNQFTGGVWQLTAITSNTQFVNYYTLAIPTSSGPQIVHVVGQVLHTTLAAATSEDPFTSLTGLTDFTVEGVLVYKVTHERGSGFGAPQNSRIVAVTGLRSNIISVTGSFSPTDHQSLSNRSAVATHPASAVSNTATGNLIATDVQGALNELQGDIDAFATPTFTTSATIIGTTASSLTIDTTTNATTDTALLLLKRGTVTKWTVGNNVDGLNTDDFGIGTALTVKAATSNVLIGTTTDDTVAKLQVAGKASISQTVGIGTVAQTHLGVYMTPVLSGATTQAGIYCNATFNSSATSTGTGFLSILGTAAISFNVTDVFNFRASNVALGAGSSVTNQYGFQIDDLTAASALNIGYSSDVSSGVGKWNFYANGTASNYFNGTVLIGTTTNSAASKLQVSDDSIQIIASQSPASNGAGMAGEIAWDVNYVYVCTATNVWKRAALTGGY